MTTQSNADPVYPWLSTLNLSQPMIPNNNGTTPTRSCTISPRNIPTNTFVIFGVHQAPNISNSAPIVMSGPAAIASFDTTNMTMPNQPIQTIAQAQESDDDKQEEIQSNEQNDTEEEATNNTQNANNYKKEDTTSTDSTLMLPPPRSPYSLRVGRVIFCGYNGSTIGCRYGKKCPYSHLTPKLCEYGDKCKYMKCQFRHDDDE